jgi:hypothetical protein
VDPLNLLNCDSIPDFLEQDPVLNAYVCPISGLPIRHVVRDPTTGPQDRIYFERDQLVQWLNNNPVSPITYQPLAPHMLVVCQDIQEYIDDRLAFFSQQLRNAAQHVVLGEQAL